MNITEKLLTPNPYSRPGGERKGFLALVWHWYGYPGESALGCWTYYEKDSPKAKISGGTHYLIGNKGEIIRAVPENERVHSVGTDDKPEHLDPASGKMYTDEARKSFPAAYLTMKASPNWYCIAIEIAHLDWKGKMSPETIQSVKDLSLDICIRYNVAPKDIITTHKRIVGWKNCPKYWTDYPDQMQKEVDEIQARWEAARAGAPRPSLSIRPP